MITSQLSLHDHMCHMFTDLKSCSNAHRLVDILLFQASLNSQNIIMATIQEEVASANATTAMANMTPQEHAPEGV